MKVHWPRPLSRRVGKVILRVMERRQRFHPKVESLEQRQMLSVVPPWLSPAEAEEAALAISQVTTTATSDHYFITPSFGAQGSVSPQLAESGLLIHIDDVRADPRFAGLDGSGYSVVVIDTGIDLDHPFFGPDANADNIADRIVFQFDFSGDNDADASDTNDHGSHVASIVASQDPVLTGMAPGVNIIALKVFPDEVPGEPPAGADTADIEEALQWVINNAANFNVVAINMSLGGGNDTIVFNYNVERLSDELAALEAMNVTTIVAAGNSFFPFNSEMGVAQPASDPNVLAVGAVYDGDYGPQAWGNGAIDFSTGADRIASFSQRHPKIEVFAPGAIIHGANKEGGVTTQSGTSQAAPHVAGIVALAQQYSEQVLGRRLTLDELRALIRQTSKVIFDGDDEHTNVISSLHQYQRIDAFRLLNEIAFLAGVPGPQLPVQNILAVSRGPGAEPQVLVLGEDGQQQFTLAPFAAAFTGGVHVATGDVNGDGTLDIIAAAGPGGGPHVRVFDGRTGEQLSGDIGSFFAYDSAFRGGVNVASGDFDGDGRDDVVTAAGAGGGPHVRVFSGATGTLLGEFFAYDPRFTGGVHVAVGDVDGDGSPEIITGAGAGGGPHVRVFASADGTELAGWEGGIFAYDPRFTGGVHVAAGDVDGDLRSEVITGAGAGGGPHVRVINHAQADVSSFFAYDPNFAGGVHVSAANASDGRAQVVTGAGAGGGPHVRVFNGMTAAEVAGGFVFEAAFTGGVYVAAGGNAGPAVVRLAQSGSSAGTALSAAALDVVVGVAMSQLASSGLPPQIVSTLDNIQVQVASLPAGALVVSYPDAVLLDDDANGFGWSLEDDSASGIDPVETLVAEFQKILAPALVDSVFAGK